MIKINNKEVYSVLSAEKEIDKIMKGTLKVYEGWKTLIASGVPPLTLNKCKGVDLVDYKIFGNSLQGENMVNYPYLSPNGFSSNGVTFTINSDKSITANGTATADAYFQIGRITLEANKSYILYKAPKGASSTTYSLLLNGVKRVAENDEYVTLTEEKTGIFYVLIHEGNTVDNLTFYPRIVEAPTPDAPLEVESVGEYDETTGKYKIPIKVSNETEEITTNIYLNEPLRKIGDYADYIDFDNKKVVRNIKEYTLNGSESVVAYGTNTANKYRLFVAVPDAIGVSSNSVGIMSSHYLAQTASSVYLCNQGISCHGQPSFVIIYDENYQTPDSLKVFLKAQYDNGTPVKTIYLREPKEETIELPNIPTLKGINVIEVDTTIQPSNAEVIYKGK